MYVLYGLFVCSVALIRHFARYCWIQMKLRLTAVNTCAIKSAGTVQTVAPRRKLQKAYLLLLLLLLLLLCHRPTPEVLC